MAGVSVAAERDRVGAGQERSVAQASSTSSLRCSSAHPSGGVVGWAKARSAVPTNCSIRYRSVGTLRFAHPTRSRLLHAAQRKHAFAASRRNSPELCFILRPSKTKRAQGRPGADNAPAVCCAIGTRRKPHSSIQVVPITRPSLRDGRTAYAALSREPNFPSGLPRPRGIHRHPRRLTRLPPPQELDRSNDGQDHTVLPYARPAISPQFSRCRRQHRKLTDETKPSSAVRPRAATSSPGTTLPARAFRARRCRVHRKPGSRT